MDIEAIDITASGVTDESALFRLSQQIDCVRDTAKWLLSKKLADDAAAARLVSSFERASAAVANAMDPALKAEMDSLGLTIDGSAKVAEVFAISSQLAAWIDSVHCTPSFELSQRVKRAGEAKLLLELELEPAADVAGLHGQVPQLPHGTYL
jgi:hypothetical protein